MGRKTMRGENDKRRKCFQERKIKRKQVTRGETKKWITGRETPPEGAILQDWHITEVKWYFPITIAIFFYIHYKWMHDGDMNCDEEIGNSRKMMSREIWSETRMHNFPHRFQHGINDEIWTSFQIIIERAYRLQIAKVS